MDFKRELAKFGYNEGNAIDVKTLIDEILPHIFKEINLKGIKNIILNELWSFCEKEFKADFENDYIQGYGSKNGMSDRTEIFVDYLIKTINEKTN